MKHTATSLATLAALFATTSAFAQPEVEPNGSIATAGMITGVPVTRTGIISPSNDYDVYAVTVPASTSLKIRATPTSHTCMTSDLMLVFLNSAGGQLALNDDAPGMSFCPELHPARDPAMANLAGGTYYVGVNNINGANNIAYVLSVEIVDMPQPLAPVFTYQGLLRENGGDVNGQRDFTVTLWNHATSTHIDNRATSPLLVSGVNVVDGKFVLPLNFGATTFDGTERYAEIRVTNSGQGPGGTVVGPRQRLTPTPNAIFALEAKHALNATTAESALTAANATNAFHADSADMANSAWQTPWNGITGMPPEFAEGDDNDGPWNPNGSIIYYTAGGVCIGATNPSGFTFAVSGTAAKTGGGSWSVFCDSRLKHDIAPLSGTLDKLLGLRGYTFQYNQNAIEKNLALPGTQIGLMAEEVERVFPDWVEKDAQGYRYVTERATTALMVEALRDLRAEKDTAIAEKQSQIDALNARLERLEKAMQK